MKIVAVEARVYQIPGRRNAQDVPWVWGEMAQVYVSVTTEDGLEGIGEAFGYGIPGASAWWSTTRWRRCWWAGTPPRSTI